jgi:exopolyphosphatase/guanosine-5'-triphosphate,3'-diphosphate pyrophosphatase
VRVAVVDIGSNSTRLLVADVGADGAVSELERVATVTRLGEGVEATGCLGDAAQERVLATLARYAAAIDRHGCEVRTAVLTSAVRDAANGAAFTAVVRDRHGLDARTLSGDEEAAATFRGATVGRSGEALVVIDIGGGSTELVCGADGVLGFHVSTQIGVVRHSERHLRADPPRPDALEALRADVRATMEQAVPPDVRHSVAAAVAVAGTPTSCAAIDLALERYDAARVEGHVLRRDTLAAQLRDLAALPLAARRDVCGLHPDRAPTIVAGIVVLVEALDLFGLSSVEASERDILWGVALDAAERARQGVDTP